MKETGMNKNGKPITILVADDDPDDRMMIKEALEEARLANGINFVEDGVELMDYLRRRGKHTDRPGSSNHEGTGLGLPLTKSLVEMHGGCLDLQSEVGVGTTVTVRFPAERIVRLPHDTETVSAGDRFDGCRFGTCWPPRRRCGLNSSDDGH
jgi:CheY-like chemotaxis protein